MSESEREALAKLLFISRESDHWGYDAHEIAEVCERVADAILAAGYQRQPEPRDVEWGVQIMGTVSLARSEDTARAEVEFWADWEANDNPNPNATKFPRKLVCRAAAGPWGATA